ncbi:MAG: D-aminoacyl-tRNA deacylase [Acidimicrobiales bacterium]
MRALVQRVESVSVHVDGDTVGAIGPGLCVFVGATHTDTVADAERMAGRLWHLRIFGDDDGRTNLSASDLGYEILVVSQFTLYADTAKGRRPSFVRAAPAEHAEPLVDAVVDALRALGAAVATGRFRATMRVDLVNDGPFTLLLDTGA